MYLLRHFISPFAKSLLFGLAFAAVTSWAQEGDPGRITVRLVDVKFDAVNVFESAIAERARAEQEAGMPAFHVYERVRGETPGYSIIVLDTEALGLTPTEVDERWLDRIRQSVDGSTLMTLEIYPELSIGPQTLEPSGEFMRVRVRTTTPGNRQAYHNWLRDELTPMLRRGGVQDLRSGRVVLGGNTNAFVRFAYGDSFPADGGDVAERVGQEELDRTLARGDALLVSSEDYVYRFRSDLSFTDPNFQFAPQLSSVD